MPLEVGFSKSKLGDLVCITIANEEPLSNDHICGILMSVAERISQQEGSNEPVATEQSGTEIVAAPKPSGLILPRD